MITFAERFERLRFSLRLSSAQMADIFGVERQTMNKWLAGQAIPKFDCQQTLLRLECDHFAALSPHLQPETIRAFREGRARPREGAMIETVKDWTLGSLTLEFLRLVANEVGSRELKYEPRPNMMPNNAEQLGANVDADEALNILSDVAREFAGKIKPEFRYCYQLITPPQEIKHYTAYDPIHGISIRGVVHFDILRRKMLYRFDAAFS